MQVEAIGDKSVGADILCDGARPYGDEVGIPARLCTGPFGNSGAIKGNCGQSPSIETTLGLVGEFVVDVKRNAQNSFGVVRRGFR